jgi:hypothetical protein
MAKKKKMPEKYQRSGIDIIHHQKKRIRSISFLPVSHPQQFSSFDSSALSLPDKESWKR